MCFGNVLCNPAMNVFKNCIFEWNLLWIIGTDILQYTMSIKVSQLKNLRLKYSPHVGTCIASGKQVMPFQEKGQHGILGKWNSVKWKQYNALGKWHIAK